MAVDYRIAFGQRPMAGQVVFMDFAPGSRWPHRLGNVEEADGRFMPDSKANGARLRIWRSAYYSRSHL